MRQTFRTGAIKLKQRQMNAHDSLILQMEELTNDKKMSPKQASALCFPTIATSALSTGIDYNDSSTNLRLFKETEK